MSDSEILDNKTPQEARKVAPLDSAPWLAEIKASQKWKSKWHEQGRKIVRRFLDRREAEGESVNKLNIFTSNTQILIATLYAKFPKPMVTREFEDQDDDVARVAAEIVERTLKIRPRDGFDNAMRNVVQDRLVPGAGNVWFRYEPTTEKVEIPAVVLPDGTVESEASVGEQIVAEECVIDYVFWEDLLWSPARTWETVRWVGRRVKMSKADVTTRFGAKIASELNFKKASGNDKDQGTTGEYPEHDQILYAEIFEIWCKKTRKVYWVSEGLPVVLDIKPDMLNLSKFFPCPKPLMAMHSTSNFIPRPDFLIVQDQYNELDSVNNRITMLERAIKAVGVYDGTNQDIERIFTENVDNTIIPSKSFAEFMEKGGMKGAIDWIPIDMFVNALEKLRQYRQDLISQIYEMTGISDIMRGSTKASETLGAQQLKAQYGSVKLQFLQMEVATFVEEALEIKSEIIVGKFQPESILKLSNIQNSVDKDFAGPAIELLKSGDWEYRVEVHADSMAVPEFNAERDARMEFMRAIAEMMTAAAPLIEKDPGAGAGMLRMVQWAATSFRTGRTIEGILDQSIKQIELAAKQPKPQTADPAVEKAKVEIAAKGQMHQLELENKTVMADKDLEQTQRIAQAELESKERIAQAELESKERIAKYEADIQSERDKRAADDDMVIRSREADSAERAVTTESAKSDPAESMKPIVGPITEAIQASVELTKEMKDVLAVLSDNISKPRKRVLKKDKDGNSYSIEE